MKRVVVTGIGLVSPIGNNVRQSWNNILAANSGITQYLNDPILKNNTPYNLSLVKNFDYKKWKVPHANSRLNCFLASATQQALTHSKINIDILDPQRAGICIGSMGSNETKITEFVQESYSNTYANINRLSMLHLLSNIPTATLNVKYKLRGPSMTVSTACASGLSAIIQAYKWIRLNEADFVIAGGVEEVYNPLCLHSSIRLQAMTTKTYEKPEHSSRPFDKNRSGFVLGQGCGILVLEEYNSAQNRGANILAQICGYGYTSDGNNLVRPESSGIGQIMSMKNALSMASASIQQVDNFNVHATSTLAGDQIQAKSIESLLNNSKKKPLISAFKSYFGHTFGAAGAIETILGIKSMQESIVPKILNLQQPDVPTLNYAKQNQQTQINCFVKNSFGFGGINVSAVFRKL